MTNLLYLSSTSQFEAEGTITSTGRDERGGYIVLDQTIFYPQGGGQPADRGYITVSDTTIPVTFVGFQNGEVLHYLPDAYFSESLGGQKAALRVEEAFRMSSARLHTSGHLVSHVLETLAPQLIPIKGYHFPNGSYVEFLNEKGVGGAELVESANARLTADVTSGVPVSPELSDFETISRIRPNLAPFTPKDKPSRIVRIGDYLALPCGGTHVGQTGELRGLRITKTKNQKGNLKVSYELTA